MSGHHKFSQLTKDFSEERQAEINQKTAYLKTAIAIQELRQALQLSQPELANKLNIQEPAITSMEKQTEIYINHLRQVIESIGGELEIVARFPEGEIKINNFSEITKI
ncbi:helix-turn-helix transcriptional regulator [Gloeothece verrucosa]|uniref:HTH cro/C1-type domain-containing protein n=1 Tax=Gloeothece verrucosa (strain PCC 7822) TaxID=497965 RepID=E0UD59_GLOV7|nr:helix-turn-helix transcriptional regulator [Gloeothece verrucosa]ADN12939.1 conserved hypothetical protein [Gloeothece verrucosa PCC 7822]